MGERTRGMTHTFQPPSRSGGRTDMADSPETEYYRAGWDAAMAQAHARIRSAELARDHALALLVQVCVLSSRAAELSRPAFDAEVRRRQREPISPIALAE